MSKKNPSVLWTVSQDLEKADKETARANLGLNISSSSSTTGNTLSFVDAISEDSTTGNLTYSKKSVTVDQDTYSAADPSGNPASAKTIKKAIETLDGGKDTETGYYVKHVKQTDGVVTVTTEAMDTSPTANSTKPVTSGGVHSAIQTATSAVDNVRIAIYGQTTKQEILDEPDKAWFVQFPSDVTVYEYDPDPSDPDDPDPKLPIGTIFAGTVFPLSSQYIEYDGTQPAYSFLGTIRNGAVPALMNPFTTQFNMIEVNAGLYYDNTWDVVPTNTLHTEFWRNNEEPGTSYQFNRLALSDQPLFDNYVLKHCVEGKMNEHTLLIPTDETPGGVPTIAQGDKVFTLDGKWKEFTGSSSGSYYDLVDAPYAPTVTSDEIKFGTTRVTTDGSAQTIYSRVAEISYTFSNSDGPVCIIGRVIVHQYRYQNPVTINYRLLWSRNAEVTQAYCDIMSGNEAQIKVENFRIGYIATTSKLTLYIKLKGNYICANLFVDMIQSYRGSAVGSVEYYLGTDGTSSEPSGIAYLTPRYNRISTIMGFLPGQWGPDESPVPSTPYMYWLMDIVMDGTYKSITLDCLWHQGLGAYENYPPTHINIYLAVGGTAGTLSYAIVTSSDMMSVYGTMGRRPDSLACAWVHGANESPKLRLYSVGIPNANYQQSFEVLSVSTNCPDSPVFYSYTANDSQNFRDAFSWSVQTLSLRRAVWADTTTLPKGSTSTPVYIDTDGIPQTCGKVTSASSADNADTVDNYHISVGYSSASNTICFY